jgi:hypothetical protein
MPDAASGPNSRHARDDPAPLAYVRRVARDPSRNSAGVRGTIQKTRGGPSGGVFDARRVVSLLGLNSVKHDDQDDSNKNGHGCVGGGACLRAHAFKIPATFWAADRSRS